MAKVSGLFVKGLGTLILLIVTVICGVIPIRLLRAAKSKESRGGRASRMKMFVGFCNCFAGGIFFSICLLDLLPEVREKILSAIQVVGVSTTYPLGELITSIGFILMVFTEILVHSLGKGTMLMDHAHHHDGPTGEDEPLLSDQQNGHSYGYDTYFRSTNCSHHQAQVVAPAIGNDIEEESLLRNIPDSELEDITRSPSPFDELPRSVTPRIHRSKSLQSITSVNTVVHSSFRMYILVIALSLHSIFEGLSVGLLTDVDTLIQLLIALLLHKSILSFALGVKLVDGGMKAGFIIKGIVIFAAMAPIGVGVGLAVLTSFSKVASLFCSGILQGLATGSFLYVTFFEILPEEFTIQSRQKGYKLLSVVVGFLTIAGMCFYEHRFKHEMKKGKAIPTG